MNEHDLPFALCLFDQGWHQGVIGILASRVKERVNRPVFTFAPASEGSDLLKGSGRSIRAYHMRDALARIDAAHPGLIDRFGGHAMAAGLTLKAAHLKQFRAALEQDAAQTLAKAALEGEILSDGTLAASDMSMDVARMLREAGPWGHEFPEPLFDGEFEVLDTRVVGERHLKLRLQADGTREALDAIAFNADLTPWQAGGGKARLAYRLDVNCFRGRERLQLLVEHLEKIA